MVNATTFSAGEELTAADLNLKPYLHAYQSVAQNLTTAVAAAITMTQEVIDTLNGHSTSSNTSRYTPSVAGYYRCIGQVMFAVSTAGDRSAYFGLNGSRSDNAPYGAMPAMNGAGFVGGCAFAFATLHCNGTTDYIELFGSQNSGGTLATLVTSAFTNSMMIIEWMAP